MNPTNFHIPPAPAELMRCAIYTRTAADAPGNAVSQGAQWAACTRYLRGRPGWTLVADRYDDSGVTGANLDRPALQRLLADIDSARIGIVIVDDVDRLSLRALDLAALGEHLRTTGVTLVAVAQGLTTADRDGQAWHSWLSEFARRGRTAQGVGTR